VVILRTETEGASFENPKRTSMKSYFGLFHAVRVRKLIRIPDLKQKKKSQIKKLLLYSRVKINQT
jgi:hypothetical protein